SIAEAIRGLAEAPLVTKVTPVTGMQAVRPEDVKPSAESEARLTAAAQTVPPANSNSRVAATATASVAHSIAQSVAHSANLTAIPPAGAVPPPGAVGPATSLPPGG